MQNKTVLVNTLSSEPKDILTRFTMTKQNIELVKFDYLSLISKVTDRC